MASASIAHQDLVINRLRDNYEKRSNVKQIGRKIDEKTGAYMKYVSTLALNIQWAGFEEIFWFKACPAMFLDGDIRGLLLRGDVID